MKLTDEWFINELKRWKTGEWCTICEAPQWIMPDGEHWCENIPTLQNHRYHQNEEIFNLRSALKQVEHYLNILSIHMDDHSALKLAKTVVHKVLHEPK